MLITLIAFLYIFITSYAVGRYSFHALNRYLFDNPAPIGSAAMYSLTGLGVIMTGAGYYSLLQPIGLSFNIILSAVTLILLITTKNGLPVVNKLPGISVTFLLITLVFILIKTAGPITNPDTGGYHLPIVKWNETYPVVKGLANVHSRFGFNYQYLVLSAVYGFSFLNIPTLHVMNGYIMLLLVWMIVAQMSYINNRLFTRMDIIRLVCLFFALNMSNAMSSISPDFPATALTMMTILLLLKKAEEQTFFHFDATALLAFLIALSAVLFKLSAAPVLLFFIVYIPVFLKRGQLFLILFITGVLYFSPYLIRNYYISGYLVYPLYSIDWFDVDWKVPLQKAVFEKKIIWYYTLGLAEPREVALQDMFTLWLGYMKKSNPVYLLIVGALAASCIFSLIAIAYIIVRRKWEEGKPAIIVYTLLYLSLAYWFVQAPDPRFGNGFIIPFIALTAGLFAYNWLKKIPGLTVFGAIMILVLLQVAMITGKAVSSSRYNKENKVTYNLVMPASYPECNTEKQETQNGIILNKVPSAGQCWDCNLPCSFITDNYRLRGTRIQDGFMPVEE